MSASFKQLQDKVNRLETGKAKITVPPAIKNIHKSRFLKMDVARALARKILPLVLGPCLFAAGFGVCFFSFLIGPTGAIIGISVFLAGFGMLGIEEFNTPRLRYIDSIISTVKNNEIVYLHDGCFEGLTQEQRIVIAKKLTASCNLDNYELLSDMALAKKTLHLSADRVREFLTTERYGMISKIGSEQLKILESDTLLFSKELLRAYANSKVYHQDSKLLKTHLDPYLIRDLSAVKKKIASLNRYGILPFVAGGIILVTGIVLTATINTVFGILAIVGFLTAFSTVFISLKKDKMDNRVGRIENIISAIQTCELLDIGDNCFDGLSLSQRFTIVEKLIESKKITNRVLVGAAIAVDDGSYTAESAQRELTRRQNIAFDKKATVINLDGVNTNCDFCGAVLREGVKFCTHCGRKIDDRHR